jgi:hypothetical protein
VVWCGVREIKDETGSYLEFFYAPFPPHFRLMVMGRRALELGVACVVPIHEEGYRMLDEEYREAYKASHKAFRDEFTRRSGVQIETLTTFLDSAVPTEDWMMDRIIADRVHHMK